MSAESGRPWSWTDRPEDLPAVVAELAASASVAVDTESDSMHSYFEKVCLLQFATRERVMLLDPLSMEGRVEALRPIFADPGIRKVFHGSDYDVVCLKRDFAFEFANIFDTMVAAQFLDLPKIGLADLVADEFGVSLDKRHARTDWGRRPLSDAELQYACLDVLYLNELADRLTARLVKADLFEEAEIEFRRLTERAPTPREFDPDGYLKIRGTKGSADRDLSILRELYLLRDRQARRMDRPPFKVLANDTLLRIARAAPRNRNELRAIKGVTTYVQRRHGDEILEAVEKGISRGRPPAPKRRASRGQRLTPGQQRRIEQLKDWRKETAAARGVPTIAVLPNHAVLEAVLARPKTQEELAALPTVGEKRARLYGPAILAILE